MQFIRSVGLYAALGTLASVGALPAHGGEIDDLKGQLGALMSRIEQLEKRQPSAAAQATTGDEPGSFKLPGSNTSVKIGGYVQFDAIHDLRGDQGRSVDLGSIPLTGSGGDNRRNTTTFSARTSRINVQTSTPTEMGKLQTRVELDFFTPEGSEIYTNSARPRLRHAYGKVGGWLAGQTWSTFMDVDSLPETLEFVGPSGQVFIRQPMLRYTFGLGDAGALALALENPQADARDAGGKVTALDRGPDVAANWSMEKTWGHIALRGLVRPLRVEDGSGNNAASATGWGLGVSGSLKLGKGMVLYQLNHGKGIGRYIPDINSAAAYTATAPTLSAQRASGGFLAYQQGWTEKLRSTLVYGRTGIDNRSGFGPIGGLNKSTHQVHANLIWSPLKQVDVGIEYIWGERRQEDGNEGKLSRLQGAVKYTF